MNMAGKRLRDYLVCRVHVLLHRNLYHGHQEANTWLAFQLDYSLARVHKVGNGHNIRQNQGSIASMQH